MKRFLAVGCISLVLSFVAAPTALALTPAYTITGPYQNSTYHENLLSLPATGDPAFDAVAVAMTQLGYHEGNSLSDLHGNNTAGTGNFTEYCRAYGTVGGTYGYAWCAAFVTWCLRQAGAPTAAGGAFVSCTLWVEHLQLLGLYRTRTSGYEPVTGDLIFFCSAGVTRASDHVGLVRYTENGRVYTVEGNSSGCVSLRDYALSDTYIVGYGRPDYDGRRLAVSAHDLNGTRGFYTVTNSTLNVRAGCGTSYVKYGTLSRGALVEVLSVKNGWGQIDYNGKNAYISLDYAEFTTPVRYTVHYVSDRGENCPTDRDYFSYESATVTDKEPTREGYNFVCWQASSGTLYRKGDALPQDDITLTAVWEAVPTPEPQTPVESTTVPEIQETVQTEPTVAETSAAPSAVTEPKAENAAATAAAWVTGTLSVLCGGLWVWCKKRV